MTSSCGDKLEGEGVGSVEDDKPALAIAMVVCLTRYGLNWNHAEHTSRAELIAEAREFLDRPLTVRTPQMGDK